MSAQIKISGRSAEPRIEVSQGPRMGERQKDGPNREAFERTLASDPSLKEARAGLRKAKALREKVDFYRGAYECFGTHLPGDPGCAECEISTRCREVTP